MQIRSNSQLANGSNGSNGSTAHTNGTSASVNGSTNGHKYTNGYSNGDSVSNVATNGVSHSKLKKLFVLSARSETSLASYLTSFKGYLETVPEDVLSLNDLSFTLGQRRTHHNWRIAAVASSATDLQAQLSSSKPGKTRTQNISFVFTGQGAQ